MGDNQPIQPPLGLIIAPTAPDLGYNAETSWASAKGVQDTIDLDEDVVDCDGTLIKISDPAHRDLARRIFAPYDDTLERGEEFSFDETDLPAIMCAAVPFNRKESGPWFVSQGRLGRLPELNIAEATEHNGESAIMWSDRWAEARSLYDSGYSIRYFSHGDAWIGRNERLAEVWNMANAYIEVMQPYKGVPNFFFFSSLRPYTDFPDDVFFPMFAILYLAGFNVQFVLRGKG